VRNIALKKQHKNLFFRYNKPPAANSNNMGCNGPLHGGVWKEVRISQVDAKISGSQGTERVSQGSHAP